METGTETSRQSEDDVASSVNPTPLINRSRVKEFALAYCQRTDRLHVRKKKRMGTEFMVYLNTMVKELIRKRVDSQAPVGKTLR